MSSSCPAAAISSRMSTISVVPHRNGLILRFLVRNILESLFLFYSVSICVHIAGILDYQCASCVWVSIRWYPVLQIYVWHEQYRVGLQVHCHRRPQRTFPDRYCTLEHIHYYICANLLSDHKSNSAGYSVKFIFTSKWILLHYSPIWNQVLRYWSKCWPMNKCSVTCHWLTSGSGRWAWPVARLGANAWKPFTCYSVSCSASPRRKSPAVLKHFYLHF